MSWAPSASSTTVNAPPAHSNPHAAGSSQTGRVSSDATGCSHTQADSCCEPTLDRRNTQVVHRGQCLTQGECLGA